MSDDDDMPIPMRAVPGEVLRMTGIEPHPGTVRRWRTIGVGGVKLQSLRVGGRYVTRRRWIHEFFDASGRETLPTSDQVAHRIGRRQRQVDAAKRKMQAAGLM